MSLIQLTQYTFFYTITKSLMNHNNLFVKKYIFCLTCISIRKSVQSFVQLGQVCNAYARQQHSCYEGMSNLPNCKSWIFHKARNLPAWENQYKLKRGVIFQNISTRQSWSARRVVWPVWKSFQLTWCKPRTRTCWSWVKPTARTI